MDVAATSSGSGETLVGWLLILILVIVFVLLLRYAGSPGKARPHCGGGMGRRGSGGGCH